MYNLSLHDMWPRLSLFVRVYAVSVRAAPNRCCCCRRKVPKSQTQSSNWNLSLVWPLILKRTSHLLVEAAPSCVWMNLSCPTSMKRTTLCHWSSFYPDYHLDCRQQRSLRLNKWIALDWETVLRAAAAAMLSSYLSVFIHLILRLWGSARQGM